MNLTYIGSGCSYGTYTIHFTPVDKRRGCHLTLETTGSLTTCARVAQAIADSPLFKEESEYKSIDIWETSTGEVMLTFEKASD